MWTLKDLPPKTPLLPEACLRWRISASRIIRKDGSEGIWMCWSFQSEPEDPPRGIELGAVVADDGELVFLGRYQNGKLRQGLHIAASHRMALLDQGRAATSYRDGVLLLNSPWSEGQEVGRNVDFHQWVRGRIAALV